MAFEDTYGEVDSTSYAAGYYDECNDSYLDVLKSLLPNGPIWIVEACSELAGLLEGLSYSFLRVEQRALDLLEEFDPRTTVEMLEDWERVLDLPGTCPTPATSLAGRRGTVHGKLLGHGDPKPAFFKEVAEGIGYNAIVKHRENPPFVPGSVVGAPLTNNTIGLTTGSSLVGEGGWKFFWRVITAPGDDDVLLTWWIDKLTPEHSDSLVVYLGVDWHEQVNPKNVTLGGVAHNGSATAGRWCAVGNTDGVDSYIVTSERFEQYPNHMRWVERVGKKNVNLYDVAHNGSDLWCAVGQADGVNSHIITSPDAITWTEQSPTFAKNLYLKSVAYNGSDLWCAVGQADGTDPYILTSPDAVTWTQQGSGTLSNLFLWAVAHDQSGLWVACGQGGYLVTSVDGSTWVERTTPKGFNLYGVAHNGSDLWCAVGQNDGSVPSIITSPDGITWTAQTPTVVKSLGLLSICYCSTLNLWIACGVGDGADSYILTSPDGVTWTQRGAGTLKNFSLRHVAYNNGEVVAVGDADGTDAFIVTSG